ncbi:MAG TPA: polymorphic toxin type 23 domain-containing protein [Chitinophagaceae bacterium]|nr:polymorphic toxin type 23 domain-containing protein [Chitinophagaceae bacterium]
MLYNPLSVFAKKIESGFKFGLSISLGTHIQRLGVMAGAYLQTNRVQGMIMIRPHWMKQPNGHHSLFEIQCSEGIYLLSGSKNSIPMSLALLHEGSNFSRRPFAIGFHLKHYLDNNHTSQTTGIWVISYRQVSFSIENDAFLFSYRDRFRTATLMMMYEWQTRTQHAIGQSLLLGTKIQLYTGDALGKASVRKHDSLYPSRHGYWDMSKTVNGQQSEGIAAVYIQSTLPFQQSISLQVGLDDERIRHQFQNKWIHDMSWLPKRWEHFNNPHIPMLQKNGDAYLFKPQQRIRPTKLFLQAGINETSFY